MCLEFSTIHLNAQWLNISEYANSHEYMKEKHGEREKRLNMCLVPLCCDFSILTGVLVFTCIYSKKNHIKHYRWNVCPLFLKKTWQTKSSKSYCNIFAMNHWCFKSDCGQNLWKIIFATFFRPKTWWTNKLLNLIAIVWTWPTECFWSDCGQNLWIEIFVLQHFSDQHMVKKHF